MTFISNVIDSYVVFNYDIFFLTFERRERQRTGTENWGRELGERVVVDTRREIRREFREEDKEREIFAIFLFCTKTVSFIL